MNKFRLRTKKISTADEIYFNCGRNSDRLRHGFRSCAEARWLQDFALFSATTIFSCEKTVVNLHFPSLHRTFAEEEPTGLCSTMKQVRNTHIGSPARWAWSIAVLVAVAVMGACSPGQRHERLRSAYYWSTTFEMDSAKTAFLHDHHIGRLYVRYFDVVPDERQGAVPNATIRWKDPVPEAVAGNIVPVVFILNDCMKGDLSDLAQKIVGRILQMNELSRYFCNCYRSCKGCFSGMGK